MARSKVINVLLLCLFVSVFTHPARAESVKDGPPEKMDVRGKIEICANTMDRVSRLICYDTLAKDLDIIPREEAVQEEVILKKVGFWEVTKRRSPAGEDIIYLRNNAAGNVILRDGTTRRPTLIIQCKRGQTEVYLDWKTKLVIPGVIVGTTMGIAYQIDTESEHKELWELSLDRQALFSPEPVEFVKQLKQHDKLVFNITSMFDSTRTVLHDITGLDTALTLLVDRCYN